MRNKYLEKLDISRGDGNDIGGVDFVTIRAELAEKIVRSTDLNSDLNFVNVLNAQFLKGDAYFPKLGDYVNSILYDEFGQGFAIRAIKYDQLSRYYNIEMVPSNTVLEAIVKTSFLSNIQRRTFSVVDAVDGEVFEHNSLSPPPGGFGQRLFARAFLATGEETNTIEFNQLTSNSVEIVTFGEQFTGNITIEKR
jgi:hypothetical protein